MSCVGGGGAHGEGDNPLSAWLSALIEIPTEVHGHDTDADCCTNLGAEIFDAALFWRFGLARLSMRPDTGRISSCVLKAKLGAALQASFDRLEDSVAWKSLERPPRVLMT
jgi:hypothetical protein